MRPIDWPEHDQPTLLVTGGCGFIGSQFVRVILKERPRWRLINVDFLTYSGNPENLADVMTPQNSSRYSFLRADIANATVIENIFASHKIDAVVNLAAETHVDRSLLDSGPFVRTNVEGTRVLLDASVLHGVTRFLQISTDEVYGSLGPFDSPFTEESPLKPSSPYAASKAAADHLVFAYYVSFNLPTLITRCSNNYGPRQFPEKFLPMVITHALEEQFIPLYGDGQQIRDWIHADDHARALLSVLENGQPGETYNISAGQEQTNQEMIETVFAVLGKRKSLIRHVEDRPGHDRRYALDATKIRTRLGWQSCIPLQEGLRSTIAWYHDNTAWWQSIKTGDYQKFYSLWYRERLPKHLDEVHDH